MVGECYLKVQEQWEIKHLDLYTHLKLCISQTLVKYVLVIFERSRNSNYYQS